MATPFGHSLAGYAVSRFFMAEPRDRSNLVLLGMMMAVAPDLDIIPGLLHGQPVLYHGTISHSLGAAFVVSLVLAGIYKLKGWPFLTVFRLCFIAYASHLALDFFNPDGREPYGIPIFWPFSGDHFISPVPLLLGARHVSSTSASTLEFIIGVLSFYNIAAITLELILIGPFILLGRRYGYKWSGVTKSKSLYLKDPLEERHI